MTKKFKNDTNTTSKIDSKSAKRRLCRHPRKRFENCRDKIVERPKSTSEREPKSHLESMKIHTWTPRVFQILTFTLRGGAGVRPVAENLLKYSVGIRRTNFHKYLTPYCSQAIWKKTETPNLDLRQHFQLFLLHLFFRIGCLHYRSKRGG